MANFGQFMNVLDLPTKRANERIDAREDLLFKQKIEQSQKKQDFEFKVKAAKEIAAFKLKQKSQQNKDFIERMNQLDRMTGDTGGKDSGPPSEIDTQSSKAAMSLLQGGIGDVQGNILNPFEATRQASQQGQTKTLGNQFTRSQSEKQRFIVGPKGDAVKNPSFISRFDAEKFRFQKKKDARKALQDVELTDISSDLEIQARALARRIAGVRGARDMFPSIIRALQGGSNIDEIEDNIRFGGQSQALQGPIRNAAQSILINSPIAKTQQTLDFIDDELSKGKTGKVKDLLRKSSRDTAGVEERRAIMGKERTVEFLDEIQGDLDTLTSNGVGTNIFRGTIEDINKSVGRVGNKELRKVATKIAVAIQTYRRSMSGVAFSVPESAEYKTMFPSISRTGNFNEANIQALSEVISGDLRRFYALSMGEENYNLIFGKQESGRISQDSKSKLERARTMRRKNPNLSKQEIIRRVNSGE